MSRIKSNLGYLIPSSKRSHHSTWAQKPDTAWQQNKLRLNAGEVQTMHLECSTPSCKNCGVDSKDFFHMQETSFKSPETSLLLWCVEYQINSVFFLVRRSLWQWFSCCLDQNWSFFISLSISHAQRLTTLFCLATKHPKPQETHFSSSVASLTVCLFVCLSVCSCQRSCVTGSRTHRSTDRQQDKTQAPRQPKEFSRETFGGKKKSATNGFCICSQIRRSSTMSTEPRGLQGRTHPWSSWNIPTGQWDWLEPDWHNVQAEYRSVAYCFGLALGWDVLCAFVFAEHGVFHVLLFFCWTQDVPHAFVFCWTRDAPHAFDFFMCVRPNCCVVGFILLSCHHCWRWIPNLRMGSWVKTRFRAVVGSGWTVPRESQSGMYRTENNAGCVLWSMRSYYWSICTSRFENRNWTLSTEEGEEGSHTCGKTGMAGFSYLFTSVWYASVRFVPHPGYSPFLSPPDFCFFARINLRWLSSKSGNSPGWFWCSHWSNPSSWILSYERSLPAETPKVHCTCWKLRGFLFLCKAFSHSLHNDNTITNEILWTTGYC